MTAPIDIECPACASTAGNYCTSPTAGPKLSQRVTFHHAERIDAAYRQPTLPRDDPRALRDALREAVDRLAKRQDLDNVDLSFIITAREVFGI